MPMYAKPTGLLDEMSRTYPSTVCAEADNASKWLIATTNNQRFHNAGKCCNKINKFFYAMSADGIDIN